jgi:hypothetical protein
MPVPEDITARYLDDVLAVAHKFYWAHREELDRDLGRDDGQQMVTVLMFETLARRWEFYESLPRGQKTAMRYDLNNAFREYRRSQGGQEHRRKGTSKRWWSGRLDEHLNFETPWSEFWSDGDDSGDEYGYGFGDDGDDEGTPEPEYEHLYGDRGYAAMLGPWEYPIQARTHRQREKWKDKWPRPGRDDMPPWDEPYGMPVRLDLAIKPYGERLTPARSRFVSPLDGLMRLASYPFQGPAAVNRLT